MTVRRRRSSRIGEITYPREVGLGARTSGRGRRYAAQVLVGRGGELDLVRALVGQARDGQGSALLVAGEPGIGKSALLDALVEHAHAAGFLVLEALCDELGRAQPFGPLVEAMRRADLFVPGIAPDPGADLAAHPGRPSPFATGPELRARLVDAIVGNIERRCARSPVAVVVDDIHWADGATLLVLSTLARRTPDLPLLVGAAHRPLSAATELVTFVDAVERLAARRRLVLRRIELTPLDPASAASLGAAVAGGPLGPALTDLVERCHGNPLLVTELVSALRDSGALDTTAGRVDPRADVGASALPATFHETVRTRMAHLEGDARAVAGVASVLGTKFSVAELAAATRRRPRDLLPVVQGLLDVRLLLDADDALQFRHDLVRDAIASAIPSSLRVELHRSIGESLREAGAPLARVAEHVALGAVPGSPDAVDVLRHAATEISLQDPSSAVRLLRRALEICSVTDPQRDQLLAQLVDALAWSGDTQEAQEIATGVLTRPVEPAVEQTLRSALGRALLLLGRPREAIPHEERLVVLHEAREDSQAWPRALCAVCRLFAMDLDGALGDAAQAVELARADREPMGEILGLCVEVFGRNALGESVEALEAATRAVALADRTPGGEGHRLHPHLFRAISLLTLGDRRGAMAAVEQGRRLGEAIGAMWALPTYHFVTALAHWDSGAWDDLFAEVDAGVELGEEQSSAIGEVWAYAIVGRVLLFRSDLDGAAQALDRADELLADAGPQVGLDWLAHSRALLLEAQGRRREGVELLRLAWETAQGLQAAASLILFGPDLARLAVEDGDEDLAAAVCQALERISARSPRDALAAARATLVRGITERDAGPVLGAAEALGRIGHPFEAAQAQAHAGALLAVSGRATDAVDLFEAALGCFDRLAAQREADRVRAQLASLRRGVASRSPRAVTGWEALTATEREVVEEVCAGRSNPEVAARLGISRRTVEAHLRSIYAKVGVTTRLALAVAAHEREVMRAR